MCFAKLLAAQGDLLGTFFKSTAKGRFFGLWREKLVRAMSIGANGS